MTTVYSSDKSCAVVETSPKWQERPVYGTIATEPERSVIRLLKTSEMGRFPARLAAPSPTPSVLEHHVSYCSNLLGRFATVLMISSPSPV